MLPVYIDKTENTLTTPLDQREWDAMRSTKSTMSKQRMKSKKRKNSRNNNGFKKFYSLRTKKGKTVQNSGEGRIMMMEMCQVMIIHDNDIVMENWQRI